MSGDNQSSVFGFALSSLEGWHHVAATNQGDNVAIYVDGNFLAGGTVAINIPNSTAFYVRGSRGFIDELSVHDRVLTATEVRSIFDAGNAGKCGASNSSLTPTLAIDGATTRGIALHSTSFIRDPFPFTTAINFGPDQRTRIILFATNLQLLPGEGASVVTAQAEDSQHSMYPLVVEYVGNVPNFDWLSQVNIKLPDGLAQGGDVLVSLGLRGTVSNKALVSIKPAGTN